MVDDDGHDMVETRMGKALITLRETGDTRIDDPLVGVTVEDERQ